MRLRAPSLIILYLTISFVSVCHATDDWVDQTVYQSKYFNLGSRPLLFDATGQPHVFYGGNNLVHAWRSNQDGRWHKDLVDTAGLVGLDARAVQDSTGHFHVLYLATAGVLGSDPSLPVGPNIPQTVRYATNESGAWTTETLNWQTGDPWDIAVDASGIVHGAYRDLNGGLHYVTRSSSGWVDEVADVAPVTYGGGTFTTDISLIIDGTGIPHLLYEDSTAGLLKHAYKKNGTWSIEVIDSTSNPSMLDFTYSSLACDSSGHAYVAYVKNLIPRYASNVSGSWVSQVVDNTAYVPEYVSIAIDTAGHAYILFDDWQVYGSTKELKYSSNISGAWQTQVLDPIGDTSFRKALALSPSGMPHAIYMKPASTNSMELMDVYMSGGTWAIEQIDQDEHDTLGTGQNELNPYGLHSSITKDTTGALHIAYTDHTYGRLEYSTNESGEWVRQELPYTSVGTTNLAVDAAGKLHMAFSAGDVFHAVRNSGAWTFEHVTGLTALGPIAMVLDANGFVHMAAIGGNDEVQYATNRSGSWQEQSVKNVAGNGVARSDYAVGLAIDSAGTVHLGYIDGNGNLTAATNVSGSWRFTTIAPAEFDHLWAMPDILVEPTGIIHMAYVNYYCAGSCFNLGTAYGTNTSGKWIEEAVDSNAFLDNTYMSESLHPTIALDSSGIIHIAYTYAVNEYNAGGWVESDLMYARKTNGAWNISEITSGQPYTGDAPNLYVDAAGHSYISYLNIANASMNLVTGGITTPSFDVFIAPGYYDFGATQFDTTVTKTVTISNPGADPATIMGLALFDHNNTPGSASPYFRLQAAGSNPCPLNGTFSLTQGTSCNISLAYDASVNDQESVSLIAMGDGTPSRYVIANFTGTGVTSSSGSGGSGNGGTGSSGGGGGGGGSMDPIFVLVGLLWVTHRNKLPQYARRRMSIIS